MVNETLFENEIEDDKRYKSLGDSIKCQLALFDLYKFYKGVRVLNT